MPFTSAAAAGESIKLVSADKRLRVPIPDPKSGLLVSRHRPRRLRIQTRAAATVCRLLSGRQPLAAATLGAVLRGRDDTVPPTAAPRLPVAD